MQDPKNNEAITIAQILAAHLININSFQNAVDSICKDLNERVSNPRQTAIELHNNVTKIIAPSL